MDIRHDPTASRFVVATAHGEAVVEYIRTDYAVNFTHTYVPPAARGQGHAEALVQRAVAWAEAESLQIEASCSYVARFLSRRANRSSSP